MPNRIVINPNVFKDQRDALAVAWNEGLRIWMELNKFDPQFEVTPAQREFFADTAYAEDDIMLKRTIVARIITHDTSVGEITPEQLAACEELLTAILQDGDTPDADKPMVEKLLGGLPQPQNQPAESGLGESAAAPTETVEAATGGGKVGEGVGAPLNGPGITPTKAMGDGVGAPLNGPGITPTRAVGENVGAPMNGPGIQPTKAMGDGVGAPLNGPGIQPTKAMGEGVGAPLNGPGIQPMKAMGEGVGAPMNGPGIQPTKAMGEGIGAPLNGPGIQPTKAVGAGVGEPLNGPGIKATKAVGAGVGAPLNGPSLKPLKVLS